MNPIPKQTARSHIARLSKTRLRRVQLLLWAVAVVCISLSFAAGRAAVLDYNPINGDFQSYNVFRRILAGQAPYRDFANYIGMAPIVFNLPFLLVNGSFSASLFATSFTCNILFSLVALLVLWLVSENAPASLLASAVLSKLVDSGLVARLLGPGGGGYFTGLFQNLYTPSNSMRIARMAWPFLLVLAFLVFDLVWQRRTGAHYPLTAAPRRPVCSAVLGGLAGLGLPWSNDFGLSVLFTTTVLMVLLLFLQQPKQGRGCLHWYGLALAAGAFLSLFISTGGHPGSWLAFTQSVGRAQYSYFNGTGGRALLPYIFTNPRLLLYTLPYGVFLVFCLVRLVRQKLSNRLLLLGFLAFTVLAASYAYVLSGSGYNFTEALEGCFWLAALGLGVRGIAWLLRRWRAGVRLACTGALAAAAVLFALLAGRNLLAKPALPDNAVYIEALGGYAPYPKALVDAADLTENADVFSLYATGLEVVKGQFQPSGYDYVIHALGENSQKNYLDSFLAGEYPFVQTTALGVEGWLAAENWYVYRHIAAEYTPVLQTEYSRLWQRTGGQSLAVSASVDIAQQDGLWHITVTAPQGESFIADMRIAYDVAFTSAGGAVLSLGRSAAALTVPDITQPGQPVGCYLPASSDGTYIPIAVENGVGRAVLAPADRGVSRLALHSATLENALPPLAPEL